MIKIPYIEQEWQRYIYVKPLDPNIIMHILDTVPYTFYGIDKENLFKVLFVFLVGDLFLYFHDLSV